MLFLVRAHPLQQRAVIGVLLPFGHKFVDQGAGFFVSLAAQHHGLGFRAQAFKRRDGLLHTSFLQTNEAFSFRSLFSCKGDHHPRIAISYIRIAAATAALSDSAPPRMGKRKRWVASATVCGVMPAPSLPMMTHTFCGSLGLL